MHIGKKEIRIERELSDLDIFTIDFLKTSEKFIEYVLVSGYVSILLGRSRGSEDIDIIIKPVTKEQFSSYWNHLIKHNYYCLNATDAKDGYEFLKEYSLRFAKVGSVIPNMEVKQARTMLDNLAFTNKTQVAVGNDILYIGDIAMQIAYKEVVLSSPKDMEDARHLRELCKDVVTKTGIDHAKRFIKETTRN